MEKELVELYEAAKKAADASSSTDSEHEESRCIDALEQLKKFPVNYKILVNTQGSIENKNSLAGLKTVMKIVFAW
ncbi:TFIIS/LEDGF domain superfamily [Sesbania bispinosa]|nr:TFIIS/LEDGF domain superfamily [Sesbania bispinosa]